MNTNAVSEKKIGERVFVIMNTVILTLLVLACVYPLLYVLFASLSIPSQLMAQKGFLFRPLGFTLEAYRKAFEYPMILSGYKNTIFIVGVGTCVILILTTLGAFFLSRKNVFWKGPVLAMIIFTMFFHGGLIPFYMLVKNVGLDNTLWALIFPAAINTFNLIIMRTGFDSIPDSIEESAKIDGANYFTILVNICLPIIKPTIAVIVLYYAVEKWNAWFNASIFLRDRAMFPLQLVLREILILNDTKEMTVGAASGDIESISDTIKYTVIILATLPVLLIYPLLQRYFVKGIMLGAVKG